MGPQMVELAKPFPDYLIKTKPGASGASYIEHNAIRERLIGVLGRPYGWKLVELIRSDWVSKDGKKQISNCVTGACWRLTVVIDGERVEVEEIGDCEDPAFWNTDGQRAKDAASDAIKRCAMAVGCGLHLWSGEAYFLHKKLVAQLAEATETAEAA